MRHRTAVVLALLLISGAALWLSRCRQDPQNDAAGSSPEATASKPATGPAPLLEAPAAVSRTATDGAVADPTGLSYHARILSPTLEPVPLARVRLVDPDPGEEPATADADGHITIADVPYSFEILVQADGYEDLRQGVVRMQGRFEPGDLILRPARTAAIRGVVVDPQGRPISRGRVAVAPPTGSAREFQALGDFLFEEGAPVSRDGTFQIDGLPPGIPVALEHRLDAQTLASLDVHGLKGGETRDVKLVSATGVDLAVQVVNAETGKSLVGFRTPEGLNPYLKLRYRWEGQPLAGDKGEVEEEVYVDHLGDHLLLPGPGEIRLTCAGRGFQELRQTASAFPGASVTLSMVPLRRIEVEIVDEDGDPLRIRKDTLHRTGNPGTFTTVSSGEAPSLEIVARDAAEAGTPSSDRDRNYGMRPLEVLLKPDLEYVDYSRFEVFAGPGEQVLDFYWRSERIHSVPVGPEESRVCVQLELPQVPTGGLRFRIENAVTGEEAGVFRVKLDRTAGDFNRGSLLYEVSEGEFFLERLLAGTYRLSVEDPWGKGVAREDVYWSEVEIRDGEVLDLGTLTAAPLTRLEILVIDESSKPVPEATVRIWSESLKSHVPLNQRFDRGPREELRTGRDGSTPPILVPSGPSRLEVDREGHARTFHHADLRAGEVNHARVELRGGRSCRLADAILELATEVGATALQILGSSDGLVYAAVEPEASLEASVVLPAEGQFELVLLGPSGKTLDRFPLSVAGGILERTSPDSSSEQR